MQEDTLWVKQTLNGDGQAFHHLIIKHYPAIHALIMSWVKNPEDAEDLMQEVFLKAYLELASLKHPEQFRLWLRQIAKHQCQNWLCRRQEIFSQLDEDMISETPSADEVLIMRETLAKVIKAIDELPESEGQLLRERYLDDVSYDELEFRHGLSRNALAVRLLRAREKVRARVEKLLAGVGIFSWHDALRKMLSGGVEAVKIGAKVKIVAIGVAGVLVLGGAGIVLWHNQTTQIEPEPIPNQVAPKVSADVSGKEDTSSELKDNQNEKAQISQAIAFLDSLSKDGQDKAGAEDSNLKESKETIKPKEESKTGEFTLADMASRMPILREEIRTGMGHIITRGDEVIGVWQSGNVSPEKGDWINEQIREINKEWKDLFFNKVGPYNAYKSNLEGRHPYPLAEGGEFYELAQRLPHFVTPNDFDNANYIWLGDD